MITPISSQSSITSQEDAPPASPPAPLNRITEHQAQPMQSPSGSQRLADIIDEDNIIALPNHAQAPNAANIFAHDAIDNHQIDLDNPNPQAQMNNGPNFQAALMHNIDAQNQELMLDNNLHEQADQDIEPNAIDIFDSEIIERLCDKVRQNDQANTLQSFDNTLKPFLDKYNELIDLCGNDPVFIIRMNEVAQYALDHPTFIQSIIDIAADGLSNCHDRSLGSLFEMEKSYKIDQLNGQVLAGNESSETLLADIIANSRSFYNMHCLEKLAVKIGNNEAIEMMLYLMKNFKSLVQLPIDECEFRYESYAAHHTIGPPTQRVRVDSPEGQQQLTIDILQATEDTAEMARYLAGFKPYNTFLDIQTHNKSLPETNAIERIENKAYTLAEALSQLESIPLANKNLTKADLMQKNPQTAHLQTIAATLSEFKAIKNIEVIISQDIFTDLHTEVDNVQTEIDSNLTNLTRLATPQPTTRSNIPEYNAVTQQLKLLTDGLNYQIMQMYTNAALLANFERAQEHLELYSMIGFDG